LVGSSSSSRLPPCLRGSARLGLTEARNRLDHQGDSWALDALGALEARTDRIAAVLLVRNGCTVPVTQWTGDDRDRPLTLEGQEQAEVPHRTLLAFMPSRLLAAPQTRFMNTLRPLGRISVCL
jgi:8-oxo-dGTP diphosphatase